MSIIATRITSAMPPKPMVSTGSTTGRHPRAPETGQQPNCTAKIRISHRPNQNDGIVDPNKTPP